MLWKELLQKKKTNEAYSKDYHVLRFFSSFVAISGGKVVEVADACMVFCPLVKMFYKQMRHLDGSNQEAIREKIKDVIEDKIRRFGFFSERRELLKDDIAVPYGASEILMYAMQKKHVDAAVIVCDGAGSVIVTAPEVVQGIGARMNGLFYTTTIPAIVEKLKKSYGHVVFSDAHIDQIQAAEEACKLGFKRIAVTINGYMEKEHLCEIKKIEKKYGVTITTLVVCTTGASQERVLEIKEYADLVWSCASKEVREIIGPHALVQVSEKIPVFVLTPKGLSLLSAYSDSRTTIENLNSQKQYIISNRCEGEKIRMGKWITKLGSTRLPIRSSQEPSLRK